MQIAEKSGAEEKPGMVVYEGFIPFEKRMRRETL